MQAQTEPPGGSHGAERYRFGDAVVDVAAHSLEVDGAPRALEPKAYAVLVELLRHHGELVTRDELLDAVWGHRHVTSGVLTRAIAQLRHALDDDCHAPRCIQTQHALGYRFIAALDEPGPSGDTSNGTTAPPAEASSARSPADAPAPPQEPHRRAPPGRPLATRLGRRRSDRWRHWRWALASAGLVLLAWMLIAGTLTPAA